MNGNFSRGKSKLLNFASIGFLLITLVAVAYATNSGVRLFASDAKVRIQKSWEDIGNPKARQAGKQVDEVQSQAALQAAAMQNIINTAATTYLDTSLSNETRNIAASALQSLQKDGTLSTERYNQIAMQRAINDTVSKYENPDLPNAERNKAAEQLIAWQKDKTITPEFYTQITKQDEINKEVSTYLNTNLSNAERNSAAEKLQTWQKDGTITTDYYNKVAMQNTITETEKKLLDPTLSNEVRNSAASQWQAWAKDGTITPEDYNKVSLSYSAVNDLASLPSADANTRASTLARLQSYVDIGTITQQQFNDASKYYITQNDYNKCISSASANECKGIQDQIGQLKPQTATQTVSVEKTDTGFERLYTTIVRDTSGNFINAQSSQKPDTGIGLNTLLTAVNESQTQKGKDALSELERLYPGLVGLATTAIDNQNRDAYAQVQALRDAGDFTSHPTLKTFTLTDLIGDSYFIKPNAPITDTDLKSSLCLTDVTCSSKLYAQEAAKGGSLNQAVVNASNFLSLGGNQEAWRVSGLYGPGSLEFKGVALRNYAIGGAEVIGGYVGVTQFLLPTISVASLGGTATLGQSFVNLPMASQFVLANSPSLANAVNIISTVSLTAQAVDLNSKCGNDPYSVDCQNAQFYGLQSMAGIFGSIESQALQNIAIQESPINTATLQEALPDYYGTLGVSKDASLSEIRTAFRNFSNSTNNWSVGITNEQAQNIVEAFKVLSNATARAAYDEALLAGRISFGSTVGAASGATTRAPANSNVSSVVSESPSQTNTAIQLIPAESLITPSNQAGAAQITTALVLSNTEATAQNFFGNLLPVTLSTAGIPQTTQTLTHMQNSLTQVDSVFGQLAHGENYLAQGGVSEVLNPNEAAQPLAEVLSTDIAAIAAGQSTVPLTNAPSEIQNIIAANDSFANDLALSTLTTPQSPQNPIAQWVDNNLPQPVADLLTGNNPPVTQPPTEVPSSSDIVASQSIIDVPTTVTHQVETAVVEPTALETLNTAIKDNITDGPASGLIGNPTSDQYDASAAVDNPIDVVQEVVQKQVQKIIPPKKQPTFDLLPEKTRNFIQKNHGRGTISETLAVKYSYLPKGTQSWLYSPGGVEEQSSYRILLPNGKYVRAVYKLHVSATLDNFDEVIGTVSKYLRDIGIKHKVAPGTAIVDPAIGKAQYGKAITIYASEPETLAQIVGKVREIAQQQGLKGISQSELAKAHSNLAFERPVPGTNNLLYYTVEYVNGTYIGDNRKIVNGEVVSGENLYPLRLKYNGDNSPYFQQGPMRNIWNNNTRAPSRQPANLSTLQRVRNWISDTLPNTQLGIVSRESILFDETMANFGLEFRPFRNPDTGKFQFPIGKISQTPVTPQPPSTAIEPLPVLDTQAHIVGTVQLETLGSIAPWTPEGASQALTVYHGSVKPLSVDLNFTGDPEADGSLTLGTGLYTTFKQNIAQDYVTVRANGTGVVNELKVYDANILDLRTDPNNLDAPLKPMPEQLVRDWVSYVKSVKGARITATTGRILLDNVIRRMWNEYEGYLNNKILANKDFDLRNILGTNGQFSGSPPWVDDFRTFMLSKGIDGVIYTESGEVKGQPINDATLVFYNYSKVGTQADWMARVSAASQSPTPPVAKPNGLIGFGPAQLFENWANTFIENYQGLVAVQGGITPTQFGGGIAKWVGTYLSASTIRAGILGTLGFPPYMESVFSPTGLVMIRDAISPMIQNIIRPSSGIVSPGTAALLNLGNPELISPTVTQFNPNDVPGLELTADTTTGTIRADIAPETRAQGVTLLDGVSVNGQLFYPPVGGDVIKPGAFLEINGTEYIYDGINKTNGLPEFTKIAQPKPQNFLQRYVKWVDDNILHPPLGIIQPDIARLMNLGRGETAPTAPQPPAAPQLPAATVEVPPPIKPGQVFDRQIELHKILGETGKPLPQQQADLATFKAKLAYQTSGLADLQNQIVFAFRKDNPSIDNLLGIVDDYSITYGLTQNQEDAYANLIYKYSLAGQAVKDAVATMPDPKNLFKRITGINPQGDIRIIVKNYYLEITSSDPADYSAVYNQSTIKPLPAETVMANSGGFTITTTRISALDGKIIFLNPIISNKYPEFQYHEMQHVENAILSSAKLFPQAQHTDPLIDAIVLQRGPQVNREQAFKDYLTAVKGNANIQIADEMFAYKLSQAISSQNISNNDIYNALTRQGGTYNFYAIYKDWAINNFNQQSLLPASPKEQALADEIFSDNSDIENGLAAMDALVAKGYFRSEVTAILQPVPLSDWPKVAARMPVNNAAPAVENVPAPQNLLQEYVKWVDDNILHPPLGIVSPGTRAILNLGGESGSNLGLGQTIIQSLTKQVRQLPAKIAGGVVISTLFFNSAAPITVPQSVISLFNSRAGITTELVVQPPEQGIGNAGNTTSGQASGEQTAQVTSQTTKRPCMKGCTENQIVDPTQPIGRLGAKYPNGDIAGFYKMPQTNGTYKFYPIVESAGGPPTSALNALVAKNTTAAIAPAQLPGTLVSPPVTSVIPSQPITNTVTTQPPVNSIVTAINSQATSNVQTINLRARNIVLRVSDFSANLVSRINGFINSLLPPSNSTIANITGSANLPTNQTNLAPITQNTTASLNIPISNVHPVGLTQAITPGQQCNKGFCDGESMYQLYQFYTQQPDAWYLDSNGDFTPKEFLAMMVMGESLGSGLSGDALTAQATSSKIAEAISNQLGSGKTLRGKDYCTTPDCQGGVGIFNFVGSYSESAWIRYNYMLDYNKNQSAKTLAGLTDQPLADYFAKNGITLEDIANKITVNTPEDVLNSPTDWGCMSCADPGLKWIQTAIDNNAPTGTTAPNGVYYIGKDGEVVYTRAQAAYWTNFFKK